MFGCPKDFGGFLSEVWIFFMIWTPANVKKLRICICICNSPWRFEASNIHEIPEVGSSQKVYKGHKLIKDSL